MPLIIGDVYKLTWQSKRSMRFILVELNGNKAKMVTRVTDKKFWTSINDLIWISHA